MILRTFEKPINLFISGIDFINKQQTFSITDDYCSIDVILNDSKPFHIDTCGFVFILTEEEFLKIENSLDLNDGSDDCLILVNFTGTINLYMVSPSGEQWLPEPLDFTEYLQFQNPPEDDWYDVVLDLEGTYDAAVKVTGSHELIKACHG